MDLFFLKCALCIHVVKGKVPDDILTEENQSYISKT